jgi:hypothetical protein
VKNLSHKHKAVNGIFLNCKTSMGYFNSSYFRWLYTGITRASENLFTIDEPHFFNAKAILFIRKNNSNEYSG